MDFLQLLNEENQDLAKLFFQYIEKTKVTESEDHINLLHITNPLGC